MGMQNVVTLGKSWAVSYKIKYLLTRQPRNLTLSMKFSRQEYWSGLPCPPPGDPPNPGIQHRSPAFQADSLASEPPGSRRIPEWVAYPFSRGSSWSRNQTGVSCIAGGFFTNWDTSTSLVLIYTFWPFSTNSPSPHLLPPASGSHKSDLFSYEFLCFFLNYSWLTTWY